MNNEGRQYYIHGESDGMRFELAESLSKGDAQSVYQAWQIALSILGDRPLFTDIRTHLINAPSGLGHRPDEACQGHCRADILSALSGGDSSEAKPTGGRFTRGTRGEILEVETMRKRKDGTRVPQPTVGIHPYDQAASRERFQKAIRDRADFEFGYRIVHPGKGVKDIHIGHPVLDRFGDLGEFLGTVIDVTERKRAERELQQLVDFVPQLIVVLDSEGKVIHANRVAREYTGLTLEEFRSLDVIGRVIHPDDVGRVLAARKHGFAGSEPFELDARLLAKDGIHRWLLRRYNPFVEEGRVRRWYVTATESESRKQEEERVQKENVRLEERTRIAQELHDTLLQTFQSASLYLGAALCGLAQDSPAKPQLDRILQIMGQGIAEGRSAIQGLRSSGSHTSDLVVALSRIQEELEVPPDIDFRVIVTGRQRPLPREMQDEIYRIGREALANAFCHSGAKRVELELEYSDTNLRIRIRDNGRGISPQVLEKGRDGHWGLAGMRERATRISGLLKILSSASAGTEVELSIPSGIGSELSSSHHSPESGWANQYVSGSHQPKSAPTEP
jgi:PAS domain S-box-containing protein